MIFGVWLLAALAGMSASQRPAMMSPLDLVEVVGCLATSRGGGWTVERASNPTMVKTQLTTSSEIKAAEVRPLGTGEFKLIGPDVFKPGEHVGHKVAVRGLLTSSAPTPSINVTSLQTVARSCQ